MFVVWYKIEIQSSLDEFHVGEFFSEYIRYNKIYDWCKEKNP